MKALYVFPHPDDESFGVGHAMARQRRDGHEVHLLTLTRGGATKQRHRLEYSVEQMGEVRFREMQEVRKVLDLTSLIVLDFPDGGLKECDPRDLERAVREAVVRIEPHVLITYPVHGISGFHDHLVSHAVVKRVFVELEDTVPGLQRLAFSTVTEALAKASPHFALSHSTESEIDCLLPVEPQDVETCRRALDCYETFQETIERSGIKGLLPEEVAFEFFQERFAPPVADLFFELQRRR
jgi:LmbE family N-acetylglucosaminyl deacetylase